MESENKKKYKVLGLMSGSSLDGLDMAFCEFEKKGNKWLFDITRANTYSYTDEWLEKLTTTTKLSGKDLLELHIEYGRFSGDVSKEFLIKNKLIPDFIASHGHTVFHEPALGFTFQLGEGQAIASRAGCIVINDFRSKDIALGGQGAPLVPIGDEYLFNGFDYCLNLGGIANISYTKKEKRLAFDICPANQILNYLANQAGEPYDSEGNLARSGEVNNRLLNKLNNNSFYNQKPPKSLSNQFVFEHYIKPVDDFNDTIENKLATVSAHIAEQISKVILTESGNLIITGGGAYNTFLIERLKALIPNEIILPPKQIIDFKEALIFAFLGVLRMRNEINCLSSVTGATRDCSSGVIHIP